MTVMKWLDWQGRNVRNNTVVNVLVKRPHHPKKLMLYNQHPMLVGFLQQPNPSMRQFLKDNLKLQNCRRDFCLILSANEKQSIKQDNLPTVASLHAKIDTLINVFKEVKVKSLGNRKDTRPNPLLAVDGKSAKETA